jgi:hypothetical protein
MAGALPTKPPRELSIALEQITKPDKQANSNSIYEGPVYRYRYIQRTLKNTVHGGARQASDPWTALFRAC